MLLSEIIGVLGLRRIQAAAGKLELLAPHWVETMSTAPWSSESRVLIGGGTLANLGKISISSIEFS